MIKDRNVQDEAAEKHVVYLGVAICIGKRTMFFGIPVFRFRTNVNSLAPCMIIVKSSLRSQVRVSKL